MSHDKRILDILKICHMIRKILIGLCDVTEVLLHGLVPEPPHVLRNLEAMPVTL